MTPSVDARKQLERVMARHHYSGSALIEVLHAAQQLHGYLSKPMLKEIAHKLSLPPSRVLGVATFYHLFRFEAQRERKCIVCLGTACYAAGGTALMETARARGAAWTIEAGRCVGSCGLAPVVICDGRSFSRMTPPELQRQMEKP